MIKIKDLTKDDKGRYVNYSGHEEQIGTITSWNDKFIFVDYGNGAGTATSPEDLRFLTEDEEDDLPEYLNALAEQAEDDEDDIRDMMFPNREDDIDPDSDF